jgi:hypothetical protein
MTNLILIGCTKTKLDTDDRVPARQLYTSDLFAKRMAYAQRSGLPWLILSAKHGIIHPDQAIPPYDTTIADLDPRQRHDLAFVVHKQLTARGYADDATIELHAGRLYAEVLRQGMGRYQIRLPLQGLGIGQQKAWYIAQGITAVAPLVFASSLFTY